MNQSESIKPITLPNFGWMKLSDAFCKCAEELAFTREQTWELFKKAWENGKLKIRGRGSIGSGEDVSSLIVLKPEWVSRITEWGPSSSAYTNDAGEFVQEFRDSSDLPSLEGEYDIIWFNQPLDGPDKVWFAEVNIADLEAIIRLTKTKSISIGHKTDFQIKYDTKSIGLWTALDILGNQNIQGEAVFGLINLLENCAKNGEIKVTGNRANSAMRAHIPALQWEALSIDPIATKSSDGHEYSEAGAHPTDILVHDYEQCCWYNLRFDRDEIIAVRCKYLEGNSDHNTEQEKKAKERWLPAIEQVKILTTKNSSNLNPMSKNGAIKKLHEDKHPSVRGSKFSSFKAAFHRAEKDYTSEVID